MTAPASCRLAKNFSGLPMPQKAKTGWPTSILASGPGTSLPRSTGSFGGSCASAPVRSSPIRIAARQRAAAVSTDSRSGPAGITRPLPKP